MKITLFINIFINVVHSWDLSTLGISENYYVSSIAVYGTKAFLALPRSVCHNNISSPTLVEVSWTGDHLYSTSIIKNTMLKILDYQEWNKCSDFQDVISLDIESKMHKLWILDKGNEFCAPKILSYSLFYNDISESCELNNIPRENLNVLTIDPEYGEYGYRAYIGNIGDNTLLVFSLAELKWWKLILIEVNTPFNTINPDFLSASKTDPLLYITGKNTTELYTLNLEDIRNSEGPLASEIQDTIIEVNVTLVGKKLGISRGLETDYKSGLSYFMVRDYVVVRWLTGMPLEAEYHNVLAQSYEKLPYVSELFTGPQNGLWALVNPISPEECLAENTILENVSTLQSRVMKLLKYNKFSNNVY